MYQLQPNAGTITELSLACLELVFMLYLASLKRKSADCYLVLWIYLTAIPFQFSTFILDSAIDRSTILFVTYDLTKSLTLLSVIWCSYRFYKNTYPRESVIALGIFVFLFASSGYLFDHYFHVHHQVNLGYRLYGLSVCGAATMLACINYLRKIYTYSTLQVRFRIFRELWHPSTKAIALFRGFALSVFIYTAIWIIVTLLQLRVLSFTTFYFSMFTLSVAITILVAFVYFSYGQEQTSFETKLVGITLFITLGMLSLIPMIIFGSKMTADSQASIKTFVILIPLSTILVCIFLPMLFRLTILTHLNKIVAGVKMVKAGDLTATIDIGINDEIGRLTENFNQMTESLRQRTEQLHSMRETIATDFHDQTGNMLSAISQQAELLKLTLNKENKAQRMVENIISNSEELYESSKDFLWHLNHNSEDPEELLHYLTGYGQHFYNQFDIAFSSSSGKCEHQKLESSAAINLIFIFKEAMTNIVKHAGANDVRLIMSCQPKSVRLLLQDNGSWKEADSAREHYGLSNMERRCQKNNFEFSLIRKPDGTSISVKIPVMNT